MRISDWSSDVCSSDLTPGLSGEARCRGRMGPRVKAEGDNVRGGTLPCDHSCRLVAERSPLPHQPALARSEEHTSEPQSLMRNSYAVFCLKKKIQRLNLPTHTLATSHNRLPSNHHTSNN